MTNGEKLQKIFPNLEYEILSRTVLTNIDNEAWFSLDWWNTEYKEPTTKNDLGVDAISRKELLKIYEDRFSELQKLKHLKDNKGAEDRQMGVNYCINILKELSSVTPVSKECIDCIAEDKTLDKMDRIKQLLNSDKLDDEEVLKKIREVVEE